MSNEEIGKRFKDVDADTFEVGGKRFCVDDFSAGLIAEVEDGLKGNIQALANDMGFRKALDFINDVLVKKESGLGDKWGDTNIVGKDVFAVFGKLLSFFTPDLGQAAVPEQDSSLDTSKQV